MNDYNIINTREIYKGKIFDVAQETVMLPNGKETIVDVIRHNGAAAILPIDTDGKFIFVRQYRQAARSMTLEIPAGRLNHDEAHEVCAARELEEETGMKAANIQFMMRFYPAVGYSGEMIYIYAADGLSCGTQNFDEDEFITLEKYSPAEAVDLIVKGEIIDSKTIAAVLFYTRNQL